MQYKSDYHTLHKNVHIMTNWLPYRACSANGGKRNKLANLNGSPRETSTPRWWGWGSVVRKLSVLALKTRTTPLAHPMKMCSSPRHIALARSVY